MVLRIATTFMFRTAILLLELYQQTLFSKVLGLWSIPEANELMNVITIECYEVYDVPIVSKLL